uniref:Uncharacterized protein n=1 Tax=Anguilla anguilla TaxID=7936 RepID=A0A0E9WXT7_ANGAN
MNQCKAIHYKIITIIKITLQKQCTPPKKTKKNTQSQWFLLIVRSPNANIIGYPYGLRKII